MSVLLPLFELSLTHPPQDAWRLRLQPIASHDTRLAVWDKTRSALLPSGAVAVVGKTPQDEGLLHVFNRSSEGWEKRRTLAVPCPHSAETAMHLLGAGWRGQERVNVVCRKCDLIRQVDLLSGKLSVVFKGEEGEAADTRNYLGVMCTGEEGEMYVVHSVRGSVSILQLDCSTTLFRVKKTIQTGMERYHSICYIPIHRLIVITHPIHGNNYIRAVSCESGEVAWEVKGQLKGLLCHPHSMTFSPTLDSLFVGDGINSRILVLDPWDGSLRQVLPLDQKMGSVQLGLHNDQLIVRHNTAGKVILSYFSLQQEG